MQGSGQQTGTLQTSLKLSGRVLACQLRRLHRLDVHHRKTVSLTIFFPKTCTKIHRFIFVQKIRRCLLSGRPGQRRGTRQELGRFTASNCKLVSNP